MAVRTWVYFAALGLILASPSPSQDAPQPTPEDQTTTVRDQEGGGAGSDSRAAQDEANEPSVVTALEGLEAAIRDIVAEESQTEREQQAAREQRDLAAQEHMAKWAKWMFWVTAGTGVATALGVFFVWRTLVQAGETNRAAVRAAEAANEANLLTRIESRPWISIEQNVLCTFIHEKGEPRYEIFWEYKFRNNGKMPAHNIKIVWDVYCYDWAYAGAGKQGVVDVVNQAHQRSFYDLAMIFPSEIEIRDPSGSGRIKGEEEGSMFLCVCITYSLDPLGNKKGVSAQAFHLVRDDERVGPYAFKLLRINGNGYSRFE